MDLHRRIKKYLRKHISKKRYIHTLNLTKLALKLAKHHRIKKLSEIETAALLHDCGKGLGDCDKHSFLATKIAKKKFSVKDKDILNAIKYHTYGSRKMNKFSKVIYVADISEPSRKFKEAKRIRKYAFENLDKAMLLALSTKMKYVLDEKKPLSLEGVILYNKLINRRLR
ncbi:MAG: bis(5'-nucleosyl)-tetraphosphatase (symmetrical) YqeK [Elusimicrobia bacterium]|nr:bis(5'-nucleosyl)-tetraphosphatase (symmetrical) YqeK [Elusimicrobiota bacterium]